MAGSAMKQAALLLLAAFVQTLQAEVFRSAGSDGGDMTGELAAVLSRAKDGGELFLPKGRYFIRGAVAIEDVKNFTLRGEKGTVIVTHACPTGFLNECNGALKIRRAENFRLENIHHVGDTAGQVFGEAIQNLFGTLITQTHGVKGGAAVHFFQCIVTQAPHGAVFVLLHFFTCHTTQSRSRAISLPASTTSARTREPSLLDHHMSQFCSGKIETVKNLSVQNHAATNTGAQSDKNRTAAVFSCTGFRLPFGGTIGVVLQSNSRNTGTCFQIFYDIEIQKRRQVAGILNDAGICVSNTGRCDSAKSNLLFGTTTLQDHFLHQ